MGFIGQVTDVDASDPGTLAIGRPVVVVLAADDIGVHAGPADVLADPVDHQQVDVFKGQSRHPPLGQHQQCLFSFEEVPRSHRLDQRRLIVLVFHDPQSQQNPALFDDGSGDGTDHLIPTEVNDGLVIEGRALVLSQPDEHHLVKPALDFAVEAGVRLDPSHHRHMVGLKGQPVEQHRDSFLGAAHLDGFHGGPYGSPGEIFRDPVALDNAPLVLRNAPAVASHGRHQEGLSSQLLELMHQRLDDQGDVGNAPAAH